MYAAPAAIAITTGMIFTPHIFSFEYNYIQMNYTTFVIEYS